jgi:putative membrane protein
MARLSDKAYTDVLAALFAIIWILLAIDPLYRHDWMLENMLVVALAVAFIWWRKELHLSKLSSTLIFVFLCVHEIGAHYTYSEVPYDKWAEAVIGVSITELFGFSRNHFDRLEHFFYGLLLSYPMREAYIHARMLTGRLTYTVPITITLGLSAMYEILEWAAAEIVGGDLGVAYLGTQGDVWDAQKDMALAGFGSILAMAATFAVQAGARKRSLAARIGHVR